MGCDITFNQQIIDTAMDTAIFVPSVGNRNQFIFGIRQGRLFQCDPVTGSIITTTQFYGPTLTPSSLAYVAANDTIYVSVASDLFTNANLPGNQNVQDDIYPINPSTLAVSPGLGLGALAGSPWTFTGYPGGPTNLIAIPGTSKVAGVLFSGSTLQSNEFWIDVENTASHGKSSLDLFAVDTYYGLDWDATNNRLWNANPGGTGIGFWDLINPSGGTVWIGGPPPYPFGVAYCPDNNSVYVSTNTQEIVVYNVAGNTFSSFNLGRANATPIAIRYNPHNHLIYVPGWRDNTVCLIDPNAGNAVTVRTGFDCPNDAVFTPTKAFAVQQGLVGLLAIP